MKQLIKPAIFKGELTKPAKFCDDYPNPELERLRALNNIQLLENNNPKSPAHFCDLDLNEVLIPLWQVLPEVMPYYYVSNLGFVYSNSKNRMISMGRLNMWGYMQAQLVQVNGSHIKHYMVHRLVMMAFNPISHPELYQVNHIDGNKQNNKICNLEWCTRSQNMQHAASHGLLHPLKGEDAPTAVLTEEQVKIICEELVKRTDYKTISEDILGIPYDCGMSTAISSIRRGIRWKHISKNYKFPEINTSKQTFTNDEIHQMCKYFEEGKPISMILDLLGYGLNKVGSHERENKRKLAFKIKKRTQFKNISQNYNF